MYSFYFFYVSLIYFFFLLRYLLFLRRLLNICECFVLYVYILQLHIDISNIIYRFKLKSVILSNISLGLTLIRTPFGLENQRTYA